METAPLHAPSDSVRDTLEQLRGGALQGTTRLKLCGGLQTLPREVFELADSLEILDLSGNALDSLPPDLPRLRKLRIIFASDNRFTELPEVLGQCARLEMIGFRGNQISRVPAAALPPRLRWLVLTDNRLAALPAEIGQCGRLQKLMLAGNQLLSLPPELAACSQLELLRVAANRLPALPDWLLRQPRLSWLAFAGNPLAEPAEAAARSANAAMAASGIDWGSLRLGRLLGEGASGVIHEACWKNGAGAQPVAVKVFKGAMTSDGLPQCEMNACISAGAHPALIGVHGQITGHPARATGLVMALVPPHLRNLADPPSLQSCTRDCYRPEARLRVDAALAVARSIASAVRQLHARGILHGDLYGHNILCSDAGEALLGDFGAASFFEPGRGTLAQALPRLEVRAFGCLLEELLALCRSPGAPQSAGDCPQAEALTRLQAQCVQADVARRPLFDEIERSLDRICAAG